MSEWFTIGLQTGKNVSKKVNEFIESKDAKENFKIDSKKELRDGTTIYRWYAVWAPWNYKVEKTLIDLLTTFKYSDNEDDAFKLIAVGDDGGHDSMSNDLGFDLFEDLGETSGVMFPESFDNESDNDMINKLVDKRQACDSEDVARNLFALLNDDNSPSYAGVFEDWCYSYIHGTKEFREGLDSAIATLTGHKLSELADKIA